jgi:hypothetical protein
MQDKSSIQRRSFQKPVSPNPHARIINFPSDQSESASDWRAPASFGEMIAVIWNYYADNKTEALISAGLIIVVFIILAAL